jgi:hypothetical protein
MGLFTLKTEKIDQYEFFLHPLPHPNNQQGPAQVFVILIMKDLSPTFVKCLHWS